MLIRPGDAARYLGLSPTRFRQIVNNQEIMVIATGNTARGDRFEQHELDRYIQKKRMSRGANTCQSINAEKYGGLVSPYPEGQHLENLLDQLSKK